MKRRILIFSILVFIISIGCVSASEDLNVSDTLALDDCNQNTLNLDENGEDSIISASYTGNFKELSDLIDDTDVGGTLYLNKDYKGSGRIYIFFDITIDGQGHTIDASGKSSIFDVGYNNGVTLKNINFKNAKNEYVGSGGAIVSSSLLQLINCKFIGNTAGYGGAVFCSDAISVQGCTFQDNTANEQGGALYSSKLIVKNSVFSNNNAPKGNSICSGDLQVTDSSFTSNSKTDLIYFYNGNEAGQLYLQNNAMKSANPSAIYYEGGAPITSQVNLNFLDKTVKKGQTIEIATIKDDKGNVIRMDGLIEAQITDKNGKVVSSFKLNYNNGYKYTCNLNDGTYTVNAKVSSNVATNVKIRKGTLTVSSNPVQLKASDVTKYYKGSQKYSVTVSNNGKVVSGASVSISINGKTSTVKTDKNGVAKLALNQASGTYQITSSYGGKQITTKVTIKPTITGKDVTGTTQGTKYSVTVLNSDGTPLKNTKVSFNIGSTKYTATTNNNGIATLTLKLKVGTYNIEATNPKTAEKIKNKLTVKNPPTIKIQANDLTKYYGGSEKFTVKVTDNNGKVLANKEVKITINGKTYKRTTDKNGVASMNIVLNSKTYPVTVECGGEKVSVKITVKPTIYGKDITKMYKNGTQYYAAFADSKGNLLKNTQVEFNINGVFYKRNTDSNGVAKLTINLLPNTYILTAINPKTNELFSNKIIVKPIIVENKDLTKYYKSPSKYTLRILDNVGKPVGAGVNVDLNINGVIYHKKTDANGYVSLAINLNPGTYIVTASYNGYMASNTIKVLSILYSKDIVQGYSERIYYEVLLLNDLGKPYPNQYVILSIAGEVYKVKTDDNGIAKSRIYLDPGVYIMTASYNGLSISNTITIIKDYVFWIEML
ncbi:hypothetical protein [Methanobrevibacter sp.]|uniref:hypothetical protein n=1 Tax=Methanobrevibacter sp. TaxID=66852 RepID=UPI00388EA0A5